MVAWAVDRKGSQQKEIENNKTFRDFKENALYKNPTFAVSSVEKKGAKDRIHFNFFKSGQVLSKCRHLGRLIQAYTLLILLQRFKENVSNSEHEIALLE